MEQLFESVIKEVPNLAALVILVWLFLKHIESSRQALVVTMSELGNLIKENSGALIESREVMSRSKELVEHLDRRHHQKDTHHE